MAEQLTPEFWDKWHTDKGFLALAIPEMKDEELLTQVKSVLVYMAYTPHVIDDDVILYYRRLHRHAEKRRLSMAYSFVEIESEG